MCIVAISIQPHCCLQLNDKMTHLVDEGKAVDVTYRDLSKASDTISPNILLEKLATHGLDGCNLHWVKSWLGGQP